MKNLFRNKRGNLVERARKVLDVNPSRTRRSSKRSHQGGLTDKQRRKMSVQSAEKAERLNPWMAW